MNESSSKHHYFVETSQGEIAIWDTKPQSESQAPAVIFIHGHCTNKDFFFTSTYLFLVFELSFNCF